MNAPPSRPGRPSPFASYWQAGYEGADHINHGGVPQDMNQANGHQQRGRADYALLQQFGIRTVRESIGWRLAEQDGVVDLRFLDERLQAAQEFGLQICWTFCHYGWPADIDVYGPQFVPRFARFCRACAEYLAPYGGAAPVYSPINELSFTSWGLSVHMFRCSNMHDERAGSEAKRQLVRASIAGSDAIWQVTPGARLLQCDPLIHIVAPEGMPEWQAQAASWRAAQYDAWDMLCGRLEPELGGAPHYLDLIGANYYHDNQWECGSNMRLWWHLADTRRLPLHRLLVEVHQRYGRPILIAETSHVGSGRGAWIREIAAEVALATGQGVDSLGICLYPAIDRPAWDQPQQWHRSGLWDLAHKAPDPMQRELVLPYAQAITQAQQLTANLCERTRKQSTHQASEQLCVNFDPQSNSRETVMHNLIVFSHLRWDFVYQRPQQLLTRLAQHYQVIFIEEPVYDSGQARLQSSTPAPNVTVIRPHTPVHASGFHDEQIPVLQSLLDSLLPERSAPIVWFYTPMALPLLACFEPALVVYDCMDELSAFRSSPRQLLQRESALLNLASLVFTGGPSLYEAKRTRHPHVHCFASSVDAIHFEQALDRSNAHPMQDQLARPRLGYYGVIDERFDADLIAALADAHPEWQIVLVGPVVKIDAATLPQRHNIHYLGQQPYQALPQFLAGWDVCLMPFALNEATRYISPTKVLEYMAAELPIVSTAIHDVAVPYGDIVAIGRDHAGFIASCEAALAQTAQQTATMATRMREIVAGTSWDATATQMHGLLEQALHQGATAGEASEASNSQASDNQASDSAASAPVPQSEAGKVNELRATGAIQAVECVIIGGGPTGLSAAYHGDANTVMFERHASVGGWCRSLQDGGFTFDYAGHIMFSNDPYVLKLYDILLGENQHWQMREAWVYSKGVHTRYPFQGALYGLPPEVIKECILGAIEARHGASAAPPVAPVVCKVQQQVQPPGQKLIDDCCADGAAITGSAKQAGEARAASAEPDAAASAAPATQSFEDFIYRVWGSGIARHFAIPYNKKLWTVPLAEMETSWLGGRVPLPDLGEIIDGALQPVARPMGPNARFGYPRRGGFQALMNGFLPHIRGKLELNAEVAQVLPLEHMLALADGRRYRYEHLISTMPLPELIRLIGAQAPEAVKAAARALRHVSIRCVNIGVAREHVTDKHWIYYPEDSIFHRIFVQGNASPECNAPGGFGFTCEISYSPYKPLPCDGQELIRRCVEDCIRVGFLRADDKVLVANQVDMPYAYVVYDHARAANVALIRDWLEQHDIVLAGRYSEWEYYNSDHAFLAGRKAMEKVRSAAGGRRQAAKS